MDQSNLGFVILSSWHLRMATMKKCIFYPNQALPSLRKIQVFFHTFAAIVTNTPVLQTALSPNLCCAATMQADGELKLKQMEYVVCNILELNDDERKLFRASNSI